MLLNLDTRYKEGRSQLFRFGCKSYPDEAIEILRICTQDAIWENAIWHSALVGMAESEVSHWNEIAGFLVQANPKLYAEEPWAIAWYSRKATSYYQD